ncbi:hypothetical protein VQ643_00625 [Pseudomonas sp. F1_0610]|uniref:hypothetical protein n=1 Tax=Pseudomonas sp. F1_0610 TaxID=3114284 RepID=UPI0039C3B40E
MEEMILAAADFILNDPKGRIIGILIASISSISSYGLAVAEINAMPLALRPNYKTNMGYGMLAMRYLLGRPLLNQRNRLLLKVFRMSTLIGLLIIVILFLSFHYKGLTFFR